MTLRLRCKSAVAWDESRKSGDGLTRKRGRKPHENALYGMWMREPQLAELAEKMRHGETIDREVVSGIFKGNGTAYFSVQTAAADLTLYAKPTEQGFNLVYSPMGSKETWERELSFAELCAELHKLIRDEYERLYGAESDSPEQRLRNSTVSIS